MLTTLALGLFSAIASPQGKDLVAIRVGRAETISHGTLEHAVILVEDGKIVEVGEDLPIERGIPVLERPDWVVTPGLVNCHSRAGLGRTSGRGSQPQVKPIPEIYPRLDVWGDMLELGITTVGVYPGGNGIPGQAVAIRPYGDDFADMLVSETPYLLMYLGAGSSAKKLVRDAFGEVDKYDEKVAKEREKWEKAVEKAKKDKKKKDKDEEEADAKQEEVPKDFIPPTPDPEVAPMIDLRKGDLPAMVSISKATDFLHVLDVLDEEKGVNWFLEAGLRDDVDLFEVAEKVGERGLRIVLPARLTLQPNSRRLRNIPAEFVRAGAKLALLPQSDASSSFESWLEDVAQLVAQGLDRQVALAAVTLEAAQALGLGDRLGSLDKGKDANLVFWSGDPLEPGSQIEAVMLEGRIVHGEVER